MKIGISKEWCMRMAQHEGDTEIGAGRLAINQVLDGESVPAGVDEGEDSNIASARFDNLASSTSSAPIIRYSGGRDSPGLT